MKRKRLNAAKKRDESDEKFATSKPLNEWNVHSEIVPIYWP